VDGLREQFGGQMEFVRLNIDDPETLAERQAFDIVQRTRYALVDREGNVVQRWFGALNPTEMEQILEDFLTNQ